MLPADSVSGAVLAGGYREPVFQVITWRRGGPVDLNLVTLPGFEPESKQLYSCPLDGICFCLTLALSSFSDSNNGGEM